MSNAVKIFQGRFGRVALLDMSAPLVGHAHHHCHILLKAGGADSAFSVRGETAPLTDDSAVLVTGFYEFTRMKDGTPTPSPSRFTMLVTKRGTEWRIAHHHSSPRALPKP